MAPTLSIAHLRGAEFSARIFSTNFQRGFSARIFSAVFSADFSARDSYTPHKSTGLPSAWFIPFDATIRMDMFVYHRGGSMNPSHAVQRTSNGCVDVVNQSSKGAEL